MYILISAITRQTVLLLQSQATPRWNESKAVQKLCSSPQILVYSSICRIHWNSLFLSQKQAVYKCSFLHLECVHRKSPKGRTWSRTLFLNIQNVWCLISLLQWCVIKIMFSPKNCWVKRTKKKKNPPQKQNTASLMYMFKRREQHACLDSKWRGFSWIRSVRPAMLQQRPPSFLYMSLQVPHSFVCVKSA